MKGFFKFIGIVAAVFTAVVGALIFVDKWFNRNRLEDDYLQCDLSSEDAE